jgi:hypothetical protein
MNHQQSQSKPPQHRHTNAPDEFICPLTLELMVNPVVNRQGNCYEKAALIKWLSQPNATCPLTRQPIRLSQFIPDANLQRRIMQWRLNHGEDLDDITESSTSIDADFGAAPALFVRAPALLAVLVQEQQEQQQQQPNHDDIRRQRRRFPLLRLSPW